MCEEQKFVAKKDHLAFLVVTLFSTFTGFGGYVLLRFTLFHLTR